MLLSACQNIKKTPLVLFESLSFGMSPKSFEEELGKAIQAERPLHFQNRIVWKKRQFIFL